MSAGPVGPRAAERAVAAFVRTYGTQPTHLARSPARVNLIGEHTDYNDGFCLPVAIDLELCIALRAGAADGGRDTCIQLVSEQDPKPVALPLPPPGLSAPSVRRENRPAQGWAAYVEGVAVMLTAALSADPADSVGSPGPADAADPASPAGPAGTAGTAAVATGIIRDLGGPAAGSPAGEPAGKSAEAAAGLSTAELTPWDFGRQPAALPGWHGALASDIPVGAGLSSSAALELAVAVGWLALAGRRMDPLPLARLAQRAENEWVGVSTGLLDQLACAAGVEDHALLMDCRAGTVEPVPLPYGVAVVVLDTGTRRQVATSEYARRRAECERAARLLGVPALRDLHPELPEDAARRLDPVALARARHVVAENRRVLAVAQALRSGDAGLAGALLTEGHRSIRDDFEVSGPELDAAVAAATAAPGCFGARMTGAGFAGCVVALVARSRLAEFRAAVEAGYRERTGRPLTVFECAAAPGASASPASPSESPPDISPSASSPSARSTTPVPRKM